MDKIRPAKKHKTTIRYMTDIKTDKEGDNFPVYDKARICTSHVKEYDDALPIIARTTPASRNLLMFITREMSSEGIIRNDMHTKDKFRRKMKEWTEDNVRYTGATIDVCFSELVASNLLIRKGKGLFRVNPEYYYRNSDVKRLDSVKQEYEVRASKEKETKTTVDDNA